MKSYFNLFKYRGLIRIGIFLSLCWILLASWLYLYGLNRTYNAYSSFDFIWDIESTLSKEQIKRLPTLDQYKELEENAVDNRYLDWEVTWEILTQNSLPSLYKRHDENCRYVRYKNYAETPGKLRTTCETKLSLPGVFSFIMIPIFAFWMLIFLLTWVWKGFQK
jgi:hypothetical protein